jgi:hypothetical protein
VIALNEQLWIAQHPNIDASCAAPDAFVDVKRIPFHDVADATTGLLVESCLGRFNEPVMPRPHNGIPSAKHNGIQLEPMMELAHLKYIHAVAEKAIDRCVAFQHIAEDLVIEGVAPIGQLRVDLRKRALKVAKCMFDRWEIDHRPIPLRARGVT